MGVVTLRLPEPILSKIDKIAQESDQDRSKTIRDAIILFIGRYENAKREQQPG